MKSSLAFMYGHFHLEKITDINWKAFEIKSEIPKSGFRDEIIYKQIA